MISREILEAHYKEYASQSDDWVVNMAKTKESIIRKVFAENKFVAGNIVKILVLGVSDKRYIPIHKKIFSEVIGKALQVATFDIDIKHLSGAQDVYQHDVNKPFPDKPYEVIFSHELMKFLTPEEQLSTLKNSYEALETGGLSMHVIHAPSIKGTHDLKSWQFRVDPDKLIEKLLENNIHSQKLVFDSDSEVKWLKKTTVIILQK